MRHARIPHGTVAFVLPPSAVLAAAERDIERFKDNTNPLALAGYQEYAFHRKDVRKACKKNAMVTGADIIREALAHLERGQTTTKYNTRMLYSDPGLLRRAIGEDHEKAQA